LSFLVNRLMVGIFLYETRWHPDLHDICVVLEYAPQSGLTRVRLERILVDYELTGAGLEWSEPSAETGRLTLRMKLARVHLYELLAELVDVPGVCSVSRERCELIKASSPS
jgi:hypothetical protein